LWKALDVKVLADYFVRGLVPREECKMDVKVGSVKGMVVDKYGNSTPEMEFRAFLALMDNIPLIVGFKDLLEKFRICFDASRSDAFLEIT